ncbi:respiratory nitrate reductase subunit gamma [Streptomyces sp. NRRL B-2790]|uniref:respiratory nitrate reductase subunit gamma n=1 Tax=Streptomyces sp. NRRL B-2790 TaxID=1463835 RepID=UPI000A96E927
MTDPYDYRLGVAVWFRSLFTLDPDVTAPAHAPLVHQGHALLALALIALWPFSRMVHAFAVPLGYATRPYVLYRFRGRATGRGARPVTARRRV